MYVLDTNAIIYYLHGEVSVAKIIEEIIAMGGPLYISALTVTELTAFPKISVSEMQNIDKLLSTLVVVPVDVHIAREAGILRSAFGIDLADAVIAATASFTGSTLVTRNMRDFHIVPNLRLLKI